MVKQGKALISVKITDTGGPGGILGNRDILKAVSGSTVIPLTGEWLLTCSLDTRGLPEYPMTPDSNNYPTVLYNAMLHPIKDMPVKGVLWYQGCNNVGRAGQYSEMFPELIRDWRSIKNQPDMPFYFVQLAAFMQPVAVQPESEWAALRQAQTAALQLPNTGMVTAIDIGDPNDIHPKDKQEVARRLALLALHDTYGRTDIVASAPSPVRAIEADGSIRVEFDGALTTAGTGEPRSFIARLSDGTWTVAQGHIQGETVTLDLPAGVTEIRYDWADYPDGNLRGSTGLPVTPFAMKVAIPD